jgi:formylglycine-generating enzyme required for sulfatase activity
MQPSIAGPLPMEQTHDDTADRPQVGAVAVAQHPFPPAELSPEVLSSTPLQTDSWRAAAGLAMALQLNDSGNQPEIAPTIGKAQGPIQLQREEPLLSRLSERREVSTTVPSSVSGSAVTEADLISQQSATSGDGARAKLNALAGISAGADERPGKPATTGILHEAEAAEILLLPPTSDALPPAMTAELIGEQQRSHAAAPKISAVREPLTGIEVVPIPAGCRQMGDVDTGIIEHICVDGFMLGRTEVTNAQYRHFRPDHHSGRYHGHSLDADDQPVVAVSWHDAVAFAQWLSERTQRRYRLPTEAEWEYAAHADVLTPQLSSIGDVGGYHFVNLEQRPDPKPADEFQESTVTVESLPANAFELSGMLGNASEWVEDTYVGGSDRYGGSMHNPLVAIPGPMRVRRGGSFDDPPIMVRHSSRDFYAADLAVPQTGFRIVMEQ